VKFAGVSAYGYGRPSSSRGAVPRQHTNWDGLADRRSSSPSSSWTGFSPCYRGCGPTSVIRMPEVQKSRFSRSAINDGSQGHTAQLGPERPVRHERQPTVGTPAKM